MTFVLLAAEAKPMQVVIIVALIAAVIFGLVVLAVFARYFRYWIQSKTTGAGVGILDLLGMTHLEKYSPH